MPKMMAKPGNPLTTLDLSIVVPLHNEEESVALLHQKISAAMQTTDLDYEIIFVDDGSRDRTLELAIAITNVDPRLRVVEFRANYGQTPAMAAGIDLAKGEIIATMDGDLQNDPGDIPSMLSEMDAETHLVVGWRKNRQDKLLTRKVPSWIANRLIGKVTGVPIRDNGCSLKLYRAKVIKEVPLYAEMHRFIPAMASITGARVKEVAVTHHARQFGSSKYGLSRIYKVLLDLLSVKTLVGFAQRPLWWFGMLAFPFIIVSLVAIALALRPLILSGDNIILPFAGVGLMFASVAIFLVMVGAVSELIYSTGNIDLSEYSRLLAVDRSYAVESSRDIREKRESNDA
jgi:glycosyltransferase involved in cell wall biosynthesis